MSTEGKHVIAACIDPFDKNKKVPLNVLMCSFTAVLFKAWRSKQAILQMLKGKKPFEGALFVEGETWALTVGENMNIFSLPVEKIDEVAGIFLKSAPTADAQPEPRSDMMIMALGSNVFCADIVRFVGMDREGQVGADNDALVKQLASATSGEVMWSDTTMGEKVEKGDLFTLFLEAKTKGVIPD